MSDLTGELIDGRYQLLRQIGTGGMASIYEGFDTRLDRRVAVKIMHPHLAQDEQFVERFIREAKAAAALSHPKSVGVRLGSVKLGTTSFAAISSGISSSGTET